MSYIDWDKAIGNKVRDHNGQEIGEVENVNPDSIEVKDGLIAKKTYKIHYLTLFCFLNFSVSSLSPDSAQ